MNTKAGNKNSELICFFKAKTGFHMARVKFIISVICSMCKLQTVSYVKLAQAMEGNAEYDSKIRRIQRFFGKFTFEHGVLARLIFSLLPGEAPYHLSLDRTNWKYGKADINILMLSVCYQGVAIPLLWKMLPKRGNSNEAERKELMVNTCCCSASLQSVVLWPTESLSERVGSNTLSKRKYRFLFV
jgi:hypothetical protein